ncbi:hypothetical protein [Planktosalinus lacus]|uniref:Uncharacterized protein n=1 Tax=Planktosalinus lacus TaxID=1526573 RepID=A0A8J2YC29_9FLAO|nr:hypothetical protein [Planktosalinus lacus]GGD99553.1 hypothetical protein GCM10011312_23750 [Planktosalinus lacus]
MQRKQRENNESNERNEESNERNAESNERNAKSNWKPTGNQPALQPALRKENQLRPIAENYN